MQYAAAAAAALYLAAATAQGLALGRAPSSRLTPWLAALGALAVLGHATTLWLQVATPAGAALGPGAALSLFLFASCAVALAYSRLRPSVDRLLLVLYPLAAVALTLAAALPGEYTPRIWQGGIQLHVLLSALAFALLGIASLQLLCLRHLEGRLKQHRLGGLLPYLPPLQSQREIADHALVLGTGLLLAALLSGALFLPGGLAPTGQLAWKSLCSTHRAGALRHIAGAAPAQRLQHRAARCRADGQWLRLPAGGLLRQSARHLPLGCASQRLRAGRHLPATRL